MSITPVDAHRWAGPHDGRVAKVTSVDEDISGATPIRPLSLAFLALPNAMAAREWMSYFADLGHRVTLIVREGTIVAPGLDPRIQVEWMRRPVPLAFGRFAFWDTRRAIREVLRGVRPDVVHVHDMTSGLGWVAWLSGFHPYVVTAWGTDLYLQINRTRITRLVGRLTLRAADLVTMGSNDLRRVAIRSGASASRVEIVQFGVDTARFTPGEADPRLISALTVAERRVIFSARHIGPLYNQLSIVRAVAQLQDDVVLVLSARNATNDDVAAVRAEADALGISERIRVVPKIDHDEMAAYYRAADVVVSVPFSDSVAVTILEAMACGRPIVSSDLPSPREWLADSELSALVQPNDVGAITAAMRRLLSQSRDNIARLGAQARQLVLDRAERSSNMRFMEALYQALARPDDLAL